MVDDAEGIVCKRGTRDGDTVDKKETGRLGPVLKRRAAVRCHRGTAQTGVELLASVEAV